MTNSSSRLSTMYEGDSIDDTGYSSSVLEASPSMPPVSESPSATSSSSGSRSRYPLPNTPSVVRRNVGKGGGFVPTITPESRTRPSRGYSGGEEEDHFDQRTDGVATIRGQNVPSQRPVSYPVQIQRVASDVSKPFDENMGEQRQLHHPIQMNRMNSDGSKPFDQQIDEKSTGAVLNYYKQSSRLNTSTGEDSNQAVMNHSRGSARLSTSAREDSNQAVLDSSRGSARLNTSTGDDSNQAIFHPSQGSDRLNTSTGEDTNQAICLPSSPQRKFNSSHRSYYSDTNEDDSFGRFRMTPPRLSQPRNVPYHPGSSDRDGSDDSRDLSAAAHLSGKSPPRENGSSEAPQAKHSPQANYEEFRRNNSGSALTGESQAARRSTNQEQGHGTQNEEEGQEGGDDDSLFDFEEEARRLEEEARRQTMAAAKANKNKKVRKGRRSEEEEDDEDDTSVEKDYGAVTPQTNLQERTQAAWKRKSLAARRGASSEVSRETQSVSFGMDDTVHTFERGSALKQGVIATSARSVNSEYTKSAESEVEDVIKDIFMIGTQERTKPGRRKVKYSQTAQHRADDHLVDPADEFEDEETTLDQSDAVHETTKKYLSSSDGTERVRSRRERARPTSRRQRSMDDIDENKEEDPLAEVWSYMEGGISAVTNVLGLDSPSFDTMELTTTTEKEQDAKPKGKVKQGGFQGFMNYYSDVLLGTASNESSVCRIPAESEEKVYNKKETKKDEYPDDLETPPSLEEDLRLVDLAIQAARSAHRLQGYEFDESYDVNIVTDIKFSVVDLHLPLGLIFQENDGGCWVTKVLPEGSAMKSRSVKVGDQLAAIDGASAIRLTVDEIAKTIKGKKSVIELTFLRYVGPLRPAAGEIQEEGYEVKASSKKDPPGARDAVKEGSRRSKKNKETGTTSNSPRAQQPSPRVQQPSTQSPADKTSARVAQGGEADSGKKRFRWFGRKKQTDVE